MTCSECGRPLVLNLESMVWRCPVVVAFAELDPLRLGTAGDHDEIADECMERNVRLGGEG